ncbi:MAG: 3-isopropylmalate dehydrogenase [Dehalococcoidales bacterium]|nr:3-isopropylmalate dehydrogenase [Dehalococcoidales bacterium]
MRILVLPCDGIGPEITEATMSVLEAADNVFGLRLTCDYDDVGFVSLKKYGTTLRDEVLERAKTYDGVVLGPESHMDYPAVEKGGRNVSAGFRIGLDLYANVRPARSRPFLGRGVPNMDLVIMREATEGFYADRNMFVGWGEVMPTPDMALSIRKITAHCSERIARRAFELAMKRRRKVTAIHKVNCFKLTDGLFLNQVRKVAKEFPEVELNDVLIDAMTAHLVRDPSRFDVIVATNFYGDILSDLASELSGSIGLAGSIMASDTLCCAQAQHGSAPDIQNLDRANPTSMILSVAMMLQWIGEHQKSDTLNKAGNAMEAAVDSVLADPASRTADVGGSLGCKAFGKRVADAIHTA